MTFHVGVSVLVTLTLLVTTCQPFASSPTAEMFRQFSVTFAENLDVIESQFEDILPSDFADDVRSRGGDLEKYASVATCTACLVRTHFKDEYIIYFRFNYFVYRP